MKKPCVRVEEGARQVDAAIAAARARLRSLELFAARNRNDDSARNRESSRDSSGGRVLFRKINIKKNIYIYIIIYIQIYRYIIYESQNK